MGILIGIIFLLFSLVQLYAGYIGIEHHLSAMWAIIAILLAVVLRFTLPITIGAFF